MALGIDQKKDFESIKAVSLCALSLKFDFMASLHGNKEGTKASPQIGTYMKTL